MKNIKILKSIILFLFVIAICSCGSDDNDLIGEWQRSDFNSEFEYKLILKPDNTGFRTQREGNLKGPVISNATAFNWSEKGNILNIDFDGEIVTTSFYINSKGQLHLTDITNLYFIKLE